MRRYGVLERTRHRQFGSDTRTTERQQREQLDRTDADAARDRARDPTRSSPAPSASEEKCDRIQRATCGCQPHELRLAQEGNQCDRNRHGRGARQRPSFAHEVDTEECEREPRDGGKERGMDEMENRESVQCVGDPGHDRARSRSPSAP